MSRRPTNVTVVAVLQLVANIVSICSSLVGLLFSLGLFTLGAAFSNPGTTLIVGAIASFIMIVQIGNIILGSLGLIATCGLFKLKTWAWPLSLMLQSLVILLNLTSLLAGVITSFIDVGMASAIIYLLFRPDVKEAFRQ